MLAQQAVVSGCDPMAILGLGVILFSAAYIILLTHLYRAWGTVQSAAGLGQGLVIPTPGKAVGFLFIPFYNLYWQFIAFKGIMDAANALRNDRHLACAPFSSGVATAYAVIAVINAVGSPLFSSMNPMASLLFFALGIIAVGTLLFRVEYDLVRIINTLR